MQWIANTFGHYIWKPLRMLLLALTLVLSVFWGQTATAIVPPNTILRVDGVSGSTSGDGSAWGSSAFKYLQDAITAANNLDLEEYPCAIWVRGSTAANGLIYRPDESAASPSGTDDPNDTFRLANQVYWYGGFAGTETVAQFNNRAPGKYVTVLSGDIKVTNDYSDNSHHIITAEDVGSLEETIIDGFTIRDGNAIGADPVQTHLPGGAGAGMTVHQSTPSLSLDSAPIVVRCVFRNNEADFGGAVFCQGPMYSSPLFSNCLFSANYAEEKGGAVYNSAAGERGVNPPQCAPLSSPRFVNSVFYTNSFGEDGQGGAMYGEAGGQLNVINCTIVQNETGIYHNYSSSYTCDGAIVTNSIIYDNGDSSEADQIDLNYCIRYSCVENLVTGSTSGTCTATGNTTSNPVFVNAGLGNFRLQSTSPCIDSGEQGEFGHPDTYDLNQDADVYEYTPDRDLKRRVIRKTSCEIDMGAFEFGNPQCVGDVDGNGTVDVDDLLAVINNWGACPSAPAACDEDFEPGPCGDGTVDVDDLLALINHWGVCGVANDEGAPESIEDCHEGCIAAYPEGDEAYADCMAACIQSLCSRELLECDE